MKIAINGYEAVVPRFGYNSNTKLPNRVGSSTYNFETILNLEKIDKVNEYTIYLPVNPSRDMPEERKNWTYKIVQARKLWTLTALSSEFFFKRPQYDVYFNPTHYLPPFSPENSVVSILDLSYIYFPELFKRKERVKLVNWSKYSANKAKKIITISNSSKNDIIKEYGIDANKIAVVYPGIKDLKFNSKVKMTNIREKFDIKKNYILFVGTLQPRKNVNKLIEAFAALNTDLELVIIGKKGWQFEDILLAPKRYGVEDKVKFLHEVNDEELIEFYKNAEFFVLPSLYEGFGLPVLEAMQLGCPVITSDISSLPEAGGDAAMYFNPNDVSDIAAKMQKLIDDKGLREKMIKKGYDQVKKFSWDKSAKETLKVFEEIGNAK